MDIAEMLAVFHSIFPFAFIIVSEPWTVEHTQAVSVHPIIHNIRFHQRYFWKGRHLSAAIFRLTPMFILILIFVKSAQNVCMTSTDMFKNGNFMFNGIARMWAMCMYLVSFGNLPSHIGCGRCISLTLIISVSQQQFYQSNLMMVGAGTVSFHFNIYFVSSLQIEQVHAAQIQTFYSNDCVDNAYWNTMMSSEPKPSVKQT